jgi:hypothetical protein
MAGRTVVPVLTCTRTALLDLPAPSQAFDVANGNFCYNDGATALILLNSDGGNTHTLTVQLAAGQDGLTTGPRTLTLPISANRKMTGVWPIQFYGNQLLISADSALVLVQAVSLLGP